MRRIAVGIEDDVRKPHPPEIGANVCLRISRILGPLFAGDVRSECAQIARVQHEVRCIPAQFFDKCGTVGICHGMKNEMDLVQKFSNFRIRCKQFRQFQDMRCAGNLIGMLTAGNEQYGFCDSCLRLRNVFPL